MFSLSKQVFPKSKMYCEIANLINKYARQDNPGTTDIIMPLRPGNGPRHYGGCDTRSGNSTQSSGFASGDVSQLRRGGHRVLG